MGLRINSRNLDIRNHFYYVLFLLLLITSVRLDKKKTYLESLVLFKLIIYFKYFTTTSLHDNWRIRDSIPGIYTIILETGGPVQILPDILVRFRIRLVLCKRGLTI